MYNEKCRLNMQRLKMQDLALAMTDHQNCRYDIDGPDIDVVAVAVFCEPVIL